MGHYCTAYQLQVLLPFFLRPLWWKPRPCMVNIKSRGSRGYLGWALPAVNHTSAPLSRSRVPEWDQVRVGSGCHVRAGSETEWERRPVTLSDRVWSRTVNSCLPPYALSSLPPTSTLLFLGYFFSLLRAVRIVLLCCAVLYILLCFPMVTLLYSNVP